MLTYSLPCKHCTQVPPTPPPPTSGVGRFYYPEPSKATYVGGWKLLFAVEPVNPETEKKGKKAGKEEAVEPTEPPKRVRHGRGTYQEGAYVYEGDFQVRELGFPRPLLRLAGWCVKRNTVARLSAKRASRSPIELRSEQSLVSQPAVWGSTGLMSHELRDLEQLEARMSPYQDNDAVPLCHMNKVYPGILASLIFFSVSFLFQ